MTVLAGTSLLMLTFLGLGDVIKAWTYNRPPFQDLITLFRGSGHDQILEYFDSGCSHGIVSEYPSEQRKM